ncbi:hypothetical protein HF086_008346 [Spodoptera exigua]|uniref:VWFD domain-containing protein n=1 Tax=Spodoptera exigua TaxID=7107 RepID=A0A922M2S4_SPOEX|nr:hypothetical protein HF086_008346 [Spodoptera exigua]
MALAASGDCRPCCVEGCACPPGQLLDDNNVCVPTGLCPCYHKGLQFNAGYKEVRAGRRERELCTCVGARWDCKPATPMDIQNYPPAEDLRSNCSATNNMEFTTCEIAEPLTCKNMHLPPTSTAAECRPGCQCKKGFVLDTMSKKCVAPTECPCHHGGRSYPDGHTMQEECNKCECKSGKWSCTQRKCAGICSAWGDSHVVTFDGTDYDFEGVCTYLLAKGVMDSKDGFDVEIQVRIKMRLAGAYVFLDVPTLGMSLQWDRGMRVYVKIESMWQGRTPSGGGMAESSALIFADSWKLKPTCPKPQRCKPKKSCPEGQVYKNSTHKECVPRAKCKPVCMVLEDGREVAEGEPRQDTTPKPHDEPLKCVTGWTNWINRGEPEIGPHGESIDNEPLPRPNELTIGTPMCKEQMMKKIECRTVGDHKSPKETGLDVECSLERGLYCKEVLSLQRQLLHQHQQQQPGGVVADGCIKCQCLNNEMHCDSSECVIVSTQVQGSTHEPIIEPHIVPSTTTTSTTTTTAKPTTVEKVTSPPPECSKENLMDLLWGDQPLPDSAFSASSVASGLFEPQYAKLNGHPLDVTAGSWNPATQDQNQYIQVELPRREPIFGVKMQGSPLFDQYVTSYEVLYDSRTPETQWLEPPVEAKVIRIHPLTWHEEISIRFELVGCSEATTTAFASTGTTPTSPTIPTTKTTPTIPTTPTTPVPSTKTTIAAPLIIPSTVSPPPLCNSNSYLDLMWGDQPLPDSAFSASSVASGLFEPQYAKLNGHPLDVTVHPSGVPPPGAGIRSKDAGQPTLRSVFRGPVEHNAVSQQMLEPPVEAKVYRIQPLTWHEEISIRFELIGCKEPSNSMETTLTTIVIFMELWYMSISGLDFVKQFISLLSLLRGEFSPIFVLEALVWNKWVMGYLGIL